MVPQGDTVTLPAGSYGYITQALGGSYSVFVEGNLFRIAGKDGDAIGKEAPAPLELPADATDEQVEQLVWQQLRTCFDPEIPVNIVELGLVYEVEIKHLDEGQREIDVKMTLTAGRHSLRLHAQTLAVGQHRPARAPQHAGQGQAAGVAACDGK